MNQIIHLGLKRTTKTLVAYVINKCVKVKRLFSAITVKIGFMQNVMVQQIRNISSLIRLEADDVPWSCISFIIKQRAEIFPFGFLSKLELRDLNGVDLPSFLSILPSYDTQSKLTKLSNVGDFDIDESFAQSINSKYLNVRGLSKLSINKKDLSLFHVNLRSLTAHFDELHTLLGNLKIPFDFIGITETKQYKDNDFLTNVTIQNYDMYCQSS